MNRMRRSQLKIIETPPERAVTRLHQLMRQREALRPDFLAAWDRLAQEFSDDELEAWAEGALALANVNIGAASLVAFWRVSVEHAAALGLATLAEIAQGVAEVCRHAGAQPALSCIETIGVASRRLGDRRELARWMRGLIRLSREAPESVIAVTSRADTILQFCDGAGFESFIAAGLRAARDDRARRRAFFTLEDPLARQVLERDGGNLTFAKIERPLGLFATALWGRPPVLRGLPPPSGRTAPRRVNIAGGVIRVPQIFPGAPAHLAHDLFRASVAHATAHLALTPGRFPAGSLKPLQIALVTLVEDARVEALAIRRFPGLRALWEKFHVAERSGVMTVPALLARLSRALFDPDYVDDDDFIVKARALFAAETERLEDPALSRKIGGLLGNDIGQMRLQFDARTYVIEPAYRDDGLGLWDFGEQAETTPEEIELAVDAVRVTQEQKKDGGKSEDATQERDSAGRARPVAPDDHGIFVARYPEWDRAASIERPDWTTVREVAAALGPQERFAASIAGATHLMGRVRRMVKGARVGRHERLKRRHDGPDLDLDAVLEAAISLRTDTPPDPRVYRSAERRTRDLAVMILLDISESTRDRAGALGSVLDVERLAVGILSEALAKLGDPFALRAFASAGREEVRITRIKDFNETFDATTLMRLAALAPGLSTRLGAVLRHAGAEIAPVRSHRKLVLVLTDGEPSDIDVNDPLDLVEDARRATRTLKMQGVDVFGVTLDPSGVGSGAAVFGRSNHMPVRRLEDLPARLAELYFRLARH